MAHTLRYDDIGIHALLHEALRKEVGPLFRSSYDRNGRSLAVPVIEAQVFQKRVIPPRICPKALIIMGFFLVNLQCLTRNRYRKTLANQSYRYGY